MGFPSAEKSRLTLMGDKFYVRLTRQNIKLFYNLEVHVRFRVRHDYILFETT